MMRIGKVNCIVSAVQLEGQLSRSLSRDCEAVTLILKLSCRGSLFQQVITQLSLVT